MKSSYSAAEREVILLAAVWDLIGSMVHYGHFAKGHSLEETVLMFETREAQKIFAVVLADFLSLPTDGSFGLKKGRGGSRETTYLGELIRTARSPQFGGDTALLVAAASDFADWLDRSVTVQNVWFPAIDREGPLTVRRMTYLRICGNISKHGFTRLGTTVKHIKAVLSDNGTEISEGQSYQLIPEFQQWFFDHVFIASATTIAWHLNEIRWGIFKYLRATYQRAYQPTVTISGAQMYKYLMPSQVTDQLVQSMFWDLMNQVRSEPFFPRFTVQPYLLNEF